MKSIRDLQVILALGRLIPDSTTGSAVVWKSLREKFEGGNVLPPEWAQREPPDIHSELYSRWTREVLPAGWVDHLEDALMQSPKDFLRYLTFLRSPDSSIESRLDRLFRIQTTITDRLAKTLADPFFEILHGLRDDWNEPPSPACPNSPPPVLLRPGEILTGSQSRAIERITAMAELYFTQSPATGLRPRFSPLLIGPTGSGKTEIVSRAARHVNAHLLRVTVSQWVPIGARDASPTLKSLVDALQNHERVALFVDELDKLSDGTDVWTRSCLCEIYDVMERTLPEQLLKNKDSELLRDRARQAMWLVGAGAWQHLHAKRTGEVTGFSKVPTNISEKPLIERVLHGGFPTELLGRFHDTPIFLSYPDFNETRKILTSLGLADLARGIGREDLIQKFTWAPFGLRKLESLLADLLIEQQQLARTTSLQSTDKSA